MSTGRESVSPEPKRELNQHFSLHLHQALSDQLLSDHKMPSLSIRHASYQTKHVIQSKRRTHPLGNAWQCNDNDNDLWHDDMNVYQSNTYYTVVYATYIKYIEIQL